MGDQKKSAVHAVLDKACPALYHLSFDRESKQLQLVMDRRVWDRCWENLFPDKNHNIDFFRESGVPGMWGMSGKGPILDEHQIGYDGTCQVSKLGPLVFFTVDFNQYEEKGWLWNTYATMAVILSTFWKFDEGEYESCLPPQMVTVEQMVQPKEFMHGASCQATICHPFKEWLESNKAPRWDFDYDNPIAASMRDVGELGLTYDPPRREYNVTVRKVGRGEFVHGDSFSVHFNVPGNACGLDSSRGMCGGHMLAPHNVDSVRQAYALLVGVAELSDMALRIENQLQWVENAEG